MLNGRLWEEFMYYGKFGVVYSIMGIYGVIIRLNTSEILIITSILHESDRF